MKKTNYEYKREWALKNPEKYQQDKRRYYRRTAFAKNGWRIWTESEESAVLAHAVPDSELSKDIGRSMGAIQKRRCLLKKAGKTA